MQQIIERHIRLPNVSVLLANIEWNSVQWFHPTVPGYYVTQRLSDNHSPLRFENPSIGEAFSSVHSVGVLPPTFSVSVSPPERPFRGLSCVFENSYFESVTGLEAHQWQERTTDLLELPAGPVADLMQRIHEELRQPGFGSEVLLEAASNLLLVELARHLRREEASASRSRYRVRGGLASWQLRKIRQRLALASISGYPGLDELAALCAISEGHLMRAFKVSTGSSVHQYITRQRLQAAQALLRETRLPVAQVASQLGYSSAAYFSNAFRRISGVTPSHYRRRAMAGDTL